MALLSTFQYQAPPVNPTYTVAFATVSRAAFAQSGGAAMQSKATQLATKDATDMVHSAGVTDTEMAIVLGTAKTIRDKSLNVNGPKIYFIHTNLTATQNSGTLGLRWDLK
jgi:hypothetical protein